MDDSVFPLDDDRPGPTLHLLQGWLEGGLFTVDLGAIEEGAIIDDIEVRCVGWPGDRQVYLGVDREGRIRQLQILDGARLLHPGLIE